MTGLVKRCEEDGLVARERDPADGRAYRLSLTDRGREFQAVAEATLAELDRELLARLGPRRREALIEALEDVMEL